MADIREIAYVAVGDNHAQLIAQIVSTQGWRVTTPIDSLGAALQGFATGKYSAIILEDTHQSPVGLHVLRELRNPILHLATMMVLLDKDRAADEAVFSTHFSFHSIVKPLSRMAVIQAFMGLTKRASSPECRASADCARQLASDGPGKNAAVLAGLAELSKNMGYVHRIAHARALFHLGGAPANDVGKISHDAFKQTEAELLKHARSHPNNIVAFLILASLYTDLSMTVLARRLMQSASSVAPRFSLGNAFLAQLHLLLGEMEDAITVLGRLMQVRYMPEQTSFSLAKLYCSLGRLDQAEKLLGGQAGRFHALKSAWIESK